MIDILYLAHGREEFSAESFMALTRNTGVAHYHIYGDGKLPEIFPTDAEDINIFRARDFVGHALVTWNEAQHGGPVAIMNHYLENGSDSPIFAKIDNDVIVPPGWLEAALAVMESHPELEFLGLEPPASRTANPQTGKRAKAPEFDWLKINSGDIADADARKAMIQQGYAPCDSIGGVGLMRRSAFLNRPPMQPSGPRGVGGFTSWQQQNKVRAGWIVPPLKLFLLDRLPFEPWLSLSARYDAEGISRPWTKYDQRDAAALWEWWKP